MLWLSSSHVALNSDFREINLKDCINYSTQESLSQHCFFLWACQYFYHFPVLKQTNKQTDSNVSASSVATTYFFLPYKVNIQEINFANFSSFYFQTSTFHCQARCHQWTLKPSFTPTAVSSGLWPFISAGCSCHLFLWLCAVHSAVQNGGKLGRGLLNTWNVAVCQATELFI